MKTRTISPELITALKRLRLGGILPTLPERIGLAEKDATPFDELLLFLLVDEIERRKSTAARNRAQAAGLDPDMVVERWDKTAKVHFDKRVFQELCSLRFVEDARNVVILGPVGVGKTFLASALGHLACRSGFNVLFHRADALLRKLRQSRLDNSRDALMAELIAIDLLVVDDFALEPMTREESRERYDSPSMTRSYAAFWKRSMALCASSVSSNVVSHSAVSRLLVTTLAARPVRSTKSW